MVGQVVQSSLYLEDGDHQLHLRHIRMAQKVPGEPILMVHGAIENGKIFYSEKGKGLACFLAAVGFDVYVVDLRGRGGTKPNIKPFDSYGQTESICHDIPLFIEYVYQRNARPIHLVAHSWGGVLLTSTLCRQPQLLSKVASQVYFGTKRRIGVLNLEVLFKIKLMWRTVAPRLSKRRGFLPAKAMGFGSDDETQKSHYQSMMWTKTPHWIDSDDGFDYQQASKNIDWPPTWFIAAINDRALGHPSDVQRFIHEANYQHCKYTLLAKRNGNSKDYDHISMLTDPACIDDHFSQLIDWLGTISNDNNSSEVKCKISK